MLVSSLFWLCFSPWWQFDFEKLASSVNLTGNLNQTSLPFMVVVLWIGVAGSFIPMLLSYAALGLTSATAVGIASTAEVVFAALFGWAWLGENLSAVQLLGGCLLVVGIVIAQTSRIKKESHGND